MQFILFFILAIAFSSFAQPSDPILLAKRIHCLELLTVRATSRSQLDVAYANCTSDDVFHTVRDVGDFGPGALAYGYDEVVVIFPEIGMPDQVVLRPLFDPSTITWLDEDMVRVDYINNINFLFDPSTGGLVYHEEGFRFSTFYIFTNSTTERVSLMYDIQDPAAVVMFNSGGGILDPELVCSAFVFPACNRSNYLPNTGYSTLEECITFFATVVPNSICPFQGRSNTAACRITHAWASFIRPDVHCSHVRPVSVTCADTCFPACDNCNIHAECVATFPTLFEPVYKCQCKDGYTGDGHTCTPNSCTSNTHCARDQECVDEICQCKDTFTWNSTATKKRDQCTCEEGTIYDGVCVPIGRCSEKKHCNIQRPNTVSCSEYGHNSFTQWKHCLCNYGYEGGWEYPCTCSGEREEVVQSPGKKVCLASGECTRSGQCSHHQTCHIRGDGSGIGDCS